ncbi:MAG: tetratricopeptide repeat protein [Marinomonas sp.]
MDQENQDELNAGTAPKSGASRWGIGLLLVAALLVAGVMVWRTLNEGSSGEEIAAGSAEPGIAELLEAAESDPENTDRWLELGFAYFEQNDYAGAAKYYGKATEVDPKSAIAWSSLGEALVMQDEREPMPAKALEAFKTATSLDPTDARSRYFLAVAKDLEGDHEGALNDWLALLEDTPPGAPWETDLQRTIEQVGKVHEIDTKERLDKAMAGRSPITSGPQLTAGDAIPGPTQEQIAAASAMSPSDQDDMARGMVESLEGKLKANPKNVDGWVMLMRSRITLGEPDKAAAALKTAVAANPADAERLRTEAEIMGVK